MTNKFYAINDPKYQDLIKHDHKYFILDDYDNVFVATYSADNNSFFVTMGCHETRFIMWYCWTEEGFVGHKNQDVASSVVEDWMFTSPVRGNRILKFRPFYLDIDRFVL